MENILSLQYQSESSLTSFFEYQTNGNKCKSEIPTLLHFSEMNQAEKARKWTNLSSSYNITHSLLSSTFAESMSDSSTESIPGTRQSYPPIILSPHKRGIIQFNAMHHQPAIKPHKCFLLSLSPLCVFILEFGTEGLSIGFRKEMTPQLQETSAVEKQWHILCNSHCSRLPSLSGISFWCETSGLTSMVAPLAKMTEKTGWRGENRNALIITRIKTV